MITDTQVHSDLDPLEAPEWSLEVSLADTPDCLLSRHLDKHLQLCSDTRTVKMLLGELSDEDTSDTSEKVTSVLDKMSGTSIYFSRTLIFFVEKITLFKVPGKSLQNGQFFKKFTQIFMEVIIFLRKAFLTHHHKMRNINQ